MREEVTPAVDRALSAAHLWTARLVRPTVDALTLVLGLLDEEEGHAATLLVAAGLPVPVARDQLLAVPPEQPAGSIHDAFYAAAELARELSGERTIDGRHVLFGVLKTCDVVRGVLSCAGLKLAEIDAVRQSLAPAPLTADLDLDLLDSLDRIDTARVLDASFNRAREALRVVEDYCRFVLDDAYLSRSLKELRHELTSVMPELPFLEARDTIHDVGTTIETAAERHRDNPQMVARTNLKRLQEALRSIEEFGKVIDPSMGPSVEQLRYRSYTLERAILLGTSAREQLLAARLYLLVTSANCATSLDFVIQAAAAGGVDVIQLREKHLNDAELLDRARRVRQITRKSGTLFIVNDRPDIARLAEADGVHLGQDDLSIREARRIMGESLIGVSTHSMDQLLRAIDEGASYFGVGPVFESPTKAFAEFPGLDFVRAASTATSLPAFALGGITMNNIAQVVAAGATRVAVSSAICASDEPQITARLLRAQLP